MCVKNLLGLGLKFCPTPCGLTKNDLRAALRKVARSYRLKSFFGDTQPDAAFEAKRKIYVPTGWIPPPADEETEAIFERIASNIAKAKFYWCRLAITLCGASFS